jgi:DNA repair protein RAD5
MEAEEPQTPLFFADSGDEDEPMRSDHEQPESLDDPASDHHSELPEAPGRSDIDEPLFLAGSDSEEESPSPLAPKSAARNAVSGIDDDSDIDILSAPPTPLRNNPHPTRNVLKKRASSPDMHVDLEPGPPVKKRRLPSIEVDNGPHSASHVSQFQSAYIGTIIVTKAWSTVRGKGYIKPRDTILVERDELEDLDMKRNKAPAPSKASASSGKKQLSITSMFNPPPKKLSLAKKRKDHIMRLSNSRGFGMFLPFDFESQYMSSSGIEFARIPEDVASWISKLLDMG